MQENKIIKLNTTANRDRLPKYGHDSRLFSGDIHFLDFNTGAPIVFNTTYGGSRIAAQIASDWRFDNACKKSAYIRDEKYRRKAEEMRG